MNKNITPNLFALLIGIDRYSQTPLPDGSYYPNLGGCVRDVNHVGQMLKTRLNLADSQITKLISSNPLNGQPVEPSDQLPTYQNIVNAFKKITSEAGEGDQIYIHYSGHGGRSLTMFPELKGEDGLDESLVPCDIGENGVCYLRDIEMAYLLKAMSDRKILVTLVFDSCHSGGATRGNGGAAVRGIGSIDTRKPPENSAVADKEELINTFKAMPPAATRSINTASSWHLPTPENCVFIAACRANELANEYAFDGKERNGALTYWLLDALKQIGDGYTYKMLYNRVVAKVHAKFTSQTPQIEGDRDREIFGGIQIGTASAVNVTKVDLANQRIQLNTGLFQGVTKGTQFAIFSADASDFKDASQRLAVVELEDAGTSETWAHIVSETRANEIQEGSQAVLLGIGIRLRGRVRLVRQENEFDKFLDQLGEFINRNEDAATAQEKWIRLSKDGEEADFQVAVNRDGEFEIWDANGRPLPNLRPAISVNDGKSAELMTERLIQLTKYRNVQLIDNTDPTSRLANKVVTELGVLKENKDHSKTFVPFGNPARPLSIGEKSCLRVTNVSDTPLNIVIMDLAADWGISQIYPDPNLKDYELLEIGANNALEYEMEAYLPDDYQEGTDILKVFATVEGTSFRWLEMSPLDQPTRAISRGGMANGALEQLLTAFAAPNMRNMKPVINLSSPTGSNWTTAAVEAQVRRPTIAHVTDPALSLLQSAFDEVIAKQQDTVKSRSINGSKIEFTRPELSDPIINEISQYCVALDQNQITETELNEFDKNALGKAQERGAFDTVKYCASMAAGVAREWFNAKIWGDDAKYKAYQEALEAKFGDCDINYRNAMLQYLKYLKEGGHTPYRTWVNVDDFVIEGRLPADGIIGIVADWATGEPEALEVLRQVKNHNPQVAIHLGDIYYAGTEHEVENYFYQPWSKILEPENSGILSLALPGNHDLYSGGKPFYDLLDKLSILNGSDKKMASYFCLRNDNWQLIGLDTALHDRLGAGATYLEDSEVEWLIEKIENSGGRRTILLSHHQLFSADDQFDGKSYNEKLYNQLFPILPKIDLWHWGHEHNLVIFDEYLHLKRGRCIGGSAFPVGNFEMPATAKNADVKYNHEVALSKGSAFYQHCYAIIKLDGANALVSYYEDREGGRLLFEENL